MSPEILSDLQWTGPRGEGAVAGEIRYLRYLWQVRLLRSRESFSIKMRWAVI